MQTNLYLALFTSTIINITIKRLSALVLAGLVLSSCSSHYPSFEKKSDNIKPIVVAHRGASGYLPEHTLEAATLALKQGADYIEQDLVLSSDGHLLVLHDIHIETVTNVEDVFPNRRRADGRFYAIDFSLSEIKQLEVHERQNIDQQQVFPLRYSGNEIFRVASFEEHINLIARYNEQNNRSVGLYAEIKAPEWHLSQGVNIAEALVKALKKQNFNKPSANIYLQSFEPNSLQYLRQQLGTQFKLVQLIAENSWQESSADYEYLKTPEGLSFIASYADGIGPWMPQLYDFDTSFSMSLARDAKRHGLLIHPYTFRNDALPKGHTANDVLKIMFRDLEVDGIFTDHSDIVITWLTKNGPKKNRA